MHLKVAQENNGNKKVFPLGSDSSYSRIFRAFVFSAILLAPKVYLYLLTDGYSSNIFSDWDEPYYLNFMLTVGHNLLSTSFGEWSLALFPHSQLVYPHYAVDLILGPLMSGLGFKVTLLGLVLDFLCFSISYVLLNRFFRLLLSDSIQTEICSLVTLAFPALGLLPLLKPLEVEFLDHFYSVPIDIWPCLPVFRGVYTQVSYPLLLLGLIYSTQGILHGDRKSLIKGGIVGGLTLYTYFFAWAVSGALYFFLTVLLSRENRVKSLSTLMGCFFLTALPGIVLVQQSKATSVLQLPDTIFDFGYFSVELAVLLCICIYGATQKLFGHSTPWFFLVALILSDLSLMNAQQFLNFYITSYHFPSLYLGPFMGGMLVALACPLLSKKISSLLFFSLFVITLSLSLVESSKYSKQDEFFELVAFAQNHITSRQSIVVNPFANPLEDSPFPVTSLTPYFLVSFLPVQLVSDPVTDYSKNSLPGESLTAFFFNGKAQLLGSCPTRPLKPSSEILYGPWTFFSNLRYGICQQATSLNLRQLACEEFQKTRPKLLIWEKQFEKDFGQPRQDVLSFLWQSSAKKYSVYRVEEEEVERLLCTEPQS